MGGPLNVQTDGLRQFSETHTNIASQISQLVGGAPTASGVQTSHGQIALAVQNALGDVLGSRTGTLQNTATSGNTIAGLLSKAAKMYDDGDREGAARVKALAEKMAAEQGGAPAAGGGGGGASPASAGGGGAASQATGALGQMMGQLGQLGQMGQQSTGALQGLQQLPQQVMQGVQQIVEAATGAAGDAGDAPAATPQDPNQQGATPGLVGPAIGGVLGEADGAAGQATPEPPKST